MGVARTEQELASLSSEAPIEVLAESVATQQGCERIVRETRERLGPISILVNNAGLGSYQERVIWEQDPELWRSSLAVNLDAAFHLLRLCTPDMIDAGWGRIVIVSSTAGLAGGPATAAYTAAKHGVIGLMRSAAQDLIPHGVTCNAVCPGWVRTAMADADAETEAAATGVTASEVWEARARSYAAGRVMAARGDRRRDRLPHVRGRLGRERRGDHDRARRSLVGALTPRERTPSSAPGTPSARSARPRGRRTSSGP